MEVLCAGTRFWGGGTRIEAACMLWARAAAGHRTETCAEHASLLKLARAFVLTGPLLAVLHTLSSPKLPRLSS